MFAMTDADLAGRILGCGDGPAGFNAEATRRGASVVSCDPIYRFGRAELEARIANTYDQVIEQTRRNQHAFVWDAITSVEELGRVRMAAMRSFLDDYEAGIGEGRYVDAELPSLPFRDGEFNLALCSHFLFLYSRHCAQQAAVCLSSEWRTSSKEAGTRCCGSIAGMASISD